MNVFWHENDVVGEDSIAEEDGLMAICIRSVYVVNKIDGSPLIYDVQIGNMGACLLQNPSH